MFFRALTASSGGGGGGGEWRRGGMCPPGPPLSPALSITDELRIGAWKELKLLNWPYEKMLQNNSADPDQM